MFETLLSRLEVTPKNSPYSDFSNIKVVRFNRTTFVINGTFELFVDSIETFNVNFNFN